jgi:hypothetical protein
VGAGGSPHTRRHHKYVTVPTGCRQLPGTPPPPPLLHAATASQPPSNRRVSCPAPPHWGRGREVCSPSHSRRCRGSTPLSRQQAAGSELAAGDLLLQLVHILHKLLAAALWGVERGVGVRVKVDRRGVTGTTQAGLREGRRHGREGVQAGKGSRGYRGDRKVKGTQCAGSGERRQVTGKAGAHRGGGGGRHGTGGCGCR